MTIPSINDQLRETAIRGQATNNLCDFDTEAYLMSYGSNKAFTVTDSVATKGWRAAAALASRAFAMPTNLVLVELINSGDNLTFSKSGITNAIDVEKTGAVSVMFDRSGTFYGASTVPETTIPSTESFKRTINAEWVNGSSTLALSKFVEYPAILPTSFTLQYYSSGISCTATSDGSGNITGANITSGTINFSTGELIVQFYALTDPGMAITASYTIGILDGTVAANNAVTASSIQVKLLAAYTGKVWALYATTALEEFAGFGVGSGYVVTNAPSNTASFRWAKTKAESYQGETNGVSTFDGLWTTLRFSAKKLAGTPTINIYITDNSGTKLVPSGKELHTGPMAFSTDTVVCTPTSSLQEFVIFLRAPVGGRHVVVETTSPSGTANEQMLFLTSMQVVSGRADIPYNPSAFVLSLARPKTNRLGRDAQILVSDGKGGTRWENLSESTLIAPVEESSRRWSYFWS